MPVFECSRCNNLTYSASRFASITCDVCGGTRQRVLEHAFSFDDARAQPREIDHGDHCCVSFADPAEVVPLCVGILRRGIAESARVIGYPPHAVRLLVDEALTAEEAGAVEWQEPESVYGDAFDADEVVARFRAIAEDEERPVYVVGGADQPLSNVASADEFAAYERRATALATELGMVVVCLYDETLQPKSHLDARDATHPLTSARGALRRNGDFVYA